MADDRRLDVLRAIVEDYVSTNEPVGSKSLVERHQLGVSPATVRKDMALLGAVLNFAARSGYLPSKHSPWAGLPLPGKSKPKRSRREWLQLIVTQVDTSAVT